MLKNSFIIQGRRSGKSLALVKAASAADIPIICGTKEERVIQQKAEFLGVEIKIILL